MTHDNTTVARRATPEMSDAQPAASQNEPVSQPAERIGCTPGPWDDASNYPEFSSVRIFAGSHYVASVGNSDDPKAVTEANARLIAAAPDLLKVAHWALARLVSVSDLSDEKSEAMQLQVALRSALAKAEG